MTEYFEDLNFNNLDYDINENEELQDYLNFEKKKENNDIPIPTPLIISTRSAKCILNDLTNINLANVVSFISKKIIENHIFEKTDYFIQGIEVENMILRFDDIFKKKKNRDYYINFYGEAIDISNKEDIMLMYNHLHLLENNSLKKQGKQKDKKNKKENEHFYNSCSILVKGGPTHKIVNIKLFNNGKISLTGAKKERDGYDACVFLLEELKKQDNIFLHDKSELQDILIKDDIQNILTEIQINSSKILNDVKIILNKSNIKKNIKELKTFITKEDIFEDFEDLLDQHKCNIIIYNICKIDKINELENEDKESIIHKFNTLFSKKNVEDNEYIEHIQMLLDNYKLDESIFDIIMNIISEQEKNKHKLFIEIKHKLKKFKIIDGIYLVQVYKKEFKYQVYWNDECFDDGWYSQTELNELGYNKLLNYHQEKVNSYQKNIDKSYIDKFSISMINSDFKTQYRINLVKFLDILNESEKNIFIKFNPERYRGLIIGYFWNENKEIQDGCCNCKHECYNKKKSKKLSGLSDVCKKITIAIFKTGSVIITGGNLVQQIDDAYIFINQFFKKNYNQIIKLSIHDYQNEKEVVIKSKNKSEKSSKICT